MDRVDERNDVGNWHLKIIIAVLGAICVLLGIVGLLLPIIPGVLFLFLAVLLLSRISRRVDRWRRETPMMVRLQRRLADIRRLPLMGQARVCLWTMVGGVADGIRFACLVTSRLCAPFIARLTERSASGRARAAPGG
jgi:uncharacterized membrane protein YbaN (DUF454 family)